MTAKKAPGSRQYCHDNSSYHYTFQNEARRFEQVLAPLWPQGCPGDGMEAYVRSVEMTGVAVSGTRSTSLRTKCLGRALSIQRRCFVTVPMYGPDIRPLAILAQAHVATFTCYS
jgi:hypothetical protein